MGFQSEQKSGVSDGRPLLAITCDGERILDDKSLRAARLNIARGATSAEDLAELMAALGIDTGYEQYWEQHGIPHLTQPKLPDYNNSAVDLSWKLYQ